MTTRSPRGIGLTALALAAATALAGCAQVEQWSSGDGPAGADTSSPSASPTPTPSPSTSSPAATPTPMPTATATATPSVTPTPTASSPAPDSTASPEPTPTPTPTKDAGPRALRYGDEGADVRTLQRRLVDLGYWLGVRDGSFGPLTQQAVFALQKSAGLERDGIVGPKTRAALTKGVRPDPELSGNGVEIDLSRQILMVVRHGRPSIVLNTSTGSGEEYTSSSGHAAIATTPTGRYEVFRQVDGSDDSELGELWRPKYFHRGYAVHGSPNIPPYPASHGCARVSDDAIDMIWSRGLMDIGTTVLVHH